MKTLLFIAMLSMVACTKNTPVPQHPTTDECTGLYHHLIHVAVESSISSDLSSEQFFAATQMVDQTFRENGSYDRFFLYCSSKMTKSQMNCALRSQTLRDINNCRFVP